MDCWDNEIVVFSEEYDEALSIKKSSQQVVQVYPVMHTLSRSWGLWFYENNKTKVWDENLKHVASFQTTEEFWGLYHSIQPASKLPHGCDYCLFKEGIVPMWEDKANRRGGRWLIIIDRKFRGPYLDYLWLEVMVWLMSDHFEKHGGEVCGAVLNIRSRCDKISVWTSDARNKQCILAIGYNLKQHLGLSPDIPMAYHSHHAAIIKDQAEKKRLEEKQGNEQEKIKERENNNKKGNRKEEQVDDTEKFGGENTFINGKQEKGEDANKNEREKVTDNNNVIEKQGDEYESEEKKVDTLYYESDNTLKYKDGNYKGVYDLKNENENYNKENKGNNDCEGKDASNKARNEDDWENDGFEWENLSDKLNLVAENDSNGGVNNNEGTEDDWFNGNKDNKYEWGNEYGSNDSSLEKSNDWERENSTLGNETIGSELENKYSMLGNGDKSNEWNKKDEWGNEYGSNDSSLEKSNDWERENSMLRNETIGSVLENKYSMLGNGDKSNEWDKKDVNVLQNKKYNSELENKNEKFCGSGNVDDESDSENEAEVWVDANDEWEEDYVSIKWASVEDIYGRDNDDYVRANELVHDNEKNEANEGEGKNEIVNEKEEKK